MEKYISKSALVAEIERLISNGQVKLQESQESNDYESYIAWSEHIATCIKILSLIDTLEVKEVNLCKEEERIWKDFNMAECRLSKNDLEKISKYFFGLGMAASNKAQKGEEA